MDSSSAAAIGKSAVAIVMILSGVYLLAIGYNPLAGGLLIFAAYCIASDIQSTQKKV